MCGLPQVELRIKLATESLDIEQRFMQQDHLRLDLDVESLRDPEQTHQYLRKGNLGQRLVEYGLADGPHGGFELIDTRACWHPTGIKVQLCNAVIVAIEKCEEVLSQV